MKNLLIITILFASLQTLAQNLSLSEGTTRAVIVGISDYQNEKIPDLRFADKDAQAFTEFLQSPAGGTIPEEQIKTLLNEKATNAQIAAALEWLMEVSKEGDQAIIYFSGHGDVETKTMFQMGFLLGWDSPAQTYPIGAFPLSYLQAIVSTLSLQNKAEVTLITDACRAGKLAGSSVGGAQITNSNLSKQFANEVKILSCQPDEFSLEGAQWGGGRGVFSYHLIDGLYGMADNNDDLTVNLFEIGRYLEDKVSSETAPHSQFPMVVGSKTTTIAQVDETALALLKEKRTKEAPMLATVDSKGFEDMVDSIWQQKYQQFTVAVEEGHLLEAPSGQPVAYDLYLELIKASELESLHGTIKRNLAAAFQDDAQQAINAYLEANPTELAKRYAAETDYDRYPKYLRKAAEILGEQNFYYPYVMAKLYYFEGLQLRLGADNRVENSSYLKAIEHQLKALEYQEYSPYVLNELGVLYTRLKSRDKAIDYYESAIGMAPEWGLPYVNLSLEYYYNNDIEKAIETGDRALELMPDYPQLYNLLAWVNANFKGEYSDKRDWYRHGVELKDDFFFNHDNTSSFSQRKTKYKRSIELLEQAIQLDSQYLSAHSNLAKLYSQTGEGEKAISLLKKIISIDSTNSRAYMRLGLAYRSIRKYEEGELAYKKAIEILKEDPSIPIEYVYNDLGNLYIGWKKLDEAQAAYEKAIDLNPNYGSPYANLRRTNRDKGDFEKIEERTLRFREVSASRPEAYFTLGGYYMFVNRFEDSEWMYLKMLDLYPNYLGGIRQLIELYQKTFQQEKALKWQQKLLEISPDDLETHMKLGEFACLNGQMDKAKIHFDKALELSPSFEWMPFVIANFLRIHNEYELAERYLQIGFNLDQSSDNAFQIKSLLLYYKGQLKEALNCLDQGILLQKTADSRATLMLLKVIFYYYEEKYPEALTCSKQLEEEAPELRGISYLLEKLIEKDYESAEAVLAGFLEKFPDDPESHHINSIIKTKLGKYEEAIKSIKVAVKNHPYHFFQDNSDLKPLQELHEYQQLMREVYPEQFDDLATFNFKREEAPYYLKNCITLAKYYESQKEYQRANLLYEKVIELTPDTLSNESSFALADAYLMLGEVEKARAICPEGIDSEIDVELLNAGKLLYRLGKKAEAASHFEKYLLVSTHNLSSDFLIMFYKGQGDFEKTKELCNYLIKQSPRRMGYRRSFARLYYFFDKKQKAFQVLEEALKIAPDDFNTHALMAILRYFDNPSTAEKYFKSTSEFNSKFYDVWTCFELMRNNEFEKADKVWLELNSEFSSFWFEMAKYKYLQMKIRQGEFDQAIELFQETLINGRFVNYQLYKTDKALDPIREMEGFGKLMIQYFPEKEYR